MGNPQGHAGAGEENMRPNPEVDPVRVSDVVCALAEYWHLLDAIPHPKTQVRVSGTEHNVFISIVAPEVGFEWSVIVPRQRPGKAPKHIEIMEVVFYSLNRAIEESFPQQDSLPPRGSLSPRHPLPNLGSFRSPEGP
jgi:hypothetical protein